MARRFQAPTPGRKPYAPETGLTAFLVQLVRPSRVSEFHGKSAFRRNLPPVPPGPHQTRQRDTSRAGFRRKAPEACFQVAFPRNDQGRRESLPIRSLCAEKPERNEPASRRLRPNIFGSASLHRHASAGLYFSNPWLIPEQPYRIQKQSNRPWRQGNRPWEQFQSPYPHSPKSISPPYARFACPEPDQACIKPLL